MNATTQIDLSKFCATDEGRYSFQEPWVYKGFRYATDGKCCVRVPAPNEPDSEAARPFPPADDLFIRYTGKTWQTWPSDSYVEQFIPCKHCNETGKEICPECNQATGNECEYCEGSGGDNGPHHIVIGQRWIPVKDAELIKSLPRVEYSIDGSEGDQPMRPMPFKFDGGEGLVMPMPHKEARHA